MNRAKFYDSIRASIFGDKLVQKQVDGIDAILNEWEQQGLKDVRWLAYILGTVYHETAATMQPIEEYGKGRKYDYGKKLKYGKGPGRRTPYDKPDKLFYGRGHTQNTWYENYDALTKAAKKAGKPWDFLNNPELLLQMEPSLWATFYAMQTGLYTGKKLINYFEGEKADWINARKIINGTDKAELIAGYSKLFYAAILEAI